MAAPGPLVKWYGDKFREYLRHKNGMALMQVGIYVVSIIIRSFTASPSQPGQPPGRATGTYSRSIDSEVDTTLQVCRVGSYSVLAPWLELGTGARCELGGEAYIIRPVRRKALHWHSGGEDAFVTWVRHPGIHPRPHIRPAVRKHKREIMAIFAKAGQI